MTSLSLLNNFYPAMSYRRVQKKTKATNYCIRLSVTRYGPRNQLPAQAVNRSNLIFHRGPTVFKNMNSNEEIYHDSANETKDPIRET